MSFFAIDVIDKGVISDFILRQNVAEKHTEIAAYRALNKMARWLRTKTIRSVNQQTGLQQKLIRERLPIREMGLYPKIRGEIEAPAVFVDMVSLEPRQDPDTGEVAYITRFEARRMVGTSVYKNSFGLEVKAAEFFFYR